MPAVKDKTSRQSKAVPQTDSLRKLSFGAITKKREDARTTYPGIARPQWPIGHYCHAHHRARRTA